LIAIDINCYAYLYTYTGSIFALRVLQNVLGWVKLEGIIFTPIPPDKCQVTCPAWQTNSKWYIRSMLIFTCIVGTKGMAFHPQTPPRAHSGFNIFTLILWQLIFYSILFVNYTVDISINGNVHCLQFVNVVVYNLWMLFFTICECWVLDLLLLIIL
jgi:hypothetical protein